MHTRNRWQAMQNRVESDGKEGATWRKSRWDRLMDSVNKYWASHLPGSRHFCHQDVRAELTGRKETDKASAALSQPQVETLLGQTGVMASFLIPRKHSFWIPKFQFISHGPRPVWLQIWYPTRLQTTWELCLFTSGLRCLSIESGTQEVLNKCSLSKWLGLSERVEVWGRSYLYSLSQKWCQSWPHCPYKSYHNLPNI